MASVRQSADPELSDYALPGLLRSISSTAFWKCVLECGMVVAGQVGVWKPTCGMTQEARWPVDTHKQ